MLADAGHVAIYLDASRNPKCHDCGSMDIDQMYRKVFRCLVCSNCKNDKVEKYSLLTKTECKEVRRDSSYAFLNLRRTHVIRTTS